MSNPTTPGFVIPGVMPYQPVNQLISVNGLAVVINQVIEQGASWAKDYIWKTGLPRTPVNLTGYAGRMQIRSTHDSSVIVAELTTENGGIVLGGPAGTVRLVLSDVTTAALRPGSYVYDVELVAPGGNVRRFMRGSLRVTPEATR